MSKTLEDYQKEHGQIASTKLNDGRVLAFKAPSIEDWEDFQDALASNKKSKSVAFRQLAYKCCVSMSPEELSEVFEKRPALPVKIGDSLGEMAGTEIEFVVKKD